MRGAKEETMVSRRWWWVLAVAVLVLPGLPVRAAPAGTTLTLGVDQEVVGLDPNLVTAFSSFPRGRGVGRALMRHAEAHIFRTGPNVFLTVSDFNRRAQSFYRTLGYRNVGAIPNYVIPGITELLYRKTIGSITRRRKE